MKPNIKDKIKKIFSGVTNYKENKEEQTITFNVDHSNTIQWEKLYKLSQIIKTEDINFTGNTEHIEYSRYTSDTEYYGIIECFNVKFPL